MMITGKAIGKRKPLFADWSVPPPDDWNDDGDDGKSLADLIEHIVRLEVRAFQQRQRDRALFRALTASEISEGVERGKVEMGGSEVGIQAVDEDDAVATALQAFQDGMYLVIIDEVEYRDLQQQVFLTDDSHITFIRLTLLSGA